MAERWAVRRRSTFVVKSTRCFLWGTVAAATTYVQRVTVSRRCAGPPRRGHGSTDRARAHVQAKLHLKPPRGRTSNFQRPTFNVQLSTSNFQRPTFNVQLSTSNFQRPTFNVQLSTSTNAEQQPVSSIEHPTRNVDVERSAFDVRRSRNVTQS
jgi:hypothetical protein